MWNSAKQFLLEERQRNILQVLQLIRVKPLQFFFLQRLAWEAFTCSGRCMVEARSMTEGTGMVFLLLISGSSKSSSEFESSLFWRFPMDPLFFRKRHLDNFIFKWQRPKYLFFLVFFARAMLLYSSQLFAAARSNRWKIVLTVHFLVLWIIE